MQDQDKGDERQDVLDERQDVLDGLRDLAERQDAETGRYVARLGALDEERTRLVLRAKAVGISQKEIAEALSLSPGAVRGIVRDAEEAATGMVDRFVNDARVDAVMAERGIEEEEARAVVRDEALAERHAAFEARRARVAELVAFVHEHGDGMELRDDRAWDVLDRVERGGRLDARFARRVAGTFHGHVGSDEKCLALAHRVVAFAKEER